MNHFEMVAKLKKENLATLKRFRSALVAMEAIRSKSRSGNTELDQCYNDLIGKSKQQLDFALNVVEEAMAFRRLIRREAMAIRRLNKKDRSLE
jgi:hypothetical protein